MVLIASFHDLASCLTLCELNILCAFITNIGRGFSKIYLSPVGCCYPLNGGAFGVVSSENLYFFHHCIIF